MNIQTLLKSVVGDIEIILPEKSPVTLPSIEITEENIPLSKIFAMAMDAEKAAYNFYQNLAQRFRDREDIYKIILYIAEMKLGHYRLFEIERENAEKLRIMIQSGQWSILGHDSSHEKMRNRIWQIRADRVLEAESVVFKLFNN